METDERKHLDTYHFGSVELFGYQALRIYRRELVHELVSMLKERDVSIEFGKKYLRVVSESDTGVTVEFADGLIVETPLLIGADGIHSSIRRYIAPDVQTKYLGQTAIAGSVKSSNVRLPSPDYALPTSIFGKHGIFILAPQHIDASEMMTGTQYALPEPTREENKAISSNPEKMIEMLSRDKADWSDVVQSAMEHMIPESMYIWPFYSVPALPSWVSEGGKVIIIGDAAHAIPPTLGQGANQAFEEGLGLAIVIEKMRNGKSSGILSNWTRHRTSRIADLMAMTTKMNNNRLPKEKRDILDPADLWSADKERPGEEMRWLYGYDVQDSINSIISA